MLEEPLLKTHLARVRDARTGTEVILPPDAEVGAIYESPLRFPPRLGEHNELIFGEFLGLSQARLLDLKERGVI